MIYKVQLSNNFPMVAVYISYKHQNCPVTWLYYNSFQRKKGGLSFPNMGVTRPATATCTAGARNTRKLFFAILPILPGNHESESCV